MGELMPSNDLIRGLLYGRDLGMSDPYNQTIRQPMWYENQALQLIPGLQALGQLISRSPAKLPQQEGIEQIPLGSLADPVSQLAGLLAPVLKAYAGRQVAAPLTRTGTLSSIRGNVGSSEGEDTLDAFKRMFLQRGGVESGQGEARQLASLDQFKQSVKATMPVPEPVVEATIAPVKSTMQKAMKVLSDWNNINKDTFIADFTDRFGSIDPKTSDKLWDYFVAKKAVSATPSTSGIPTGYHAIDHDILGTLGQ